jgi:hypothetical protein
MSPIAILALGITFGETGIAMRTAIIPERLPRPE